MEMKLEIPVREGLLYSEIATVKNKLKETSSAPHGLIELPIINI